MEDSVMHWNEHAQDATEPVTNDRAGVVTADSSILGEAVREGNYRPFRLALTGYEDWLAKRIGRCIQHFPDAEAKVGRGLAIGDLVEEVFLSAFEQYPQRPERLSLREWLEGLIDPSLKTILRHLEVKGQVTEPCAHGT